MAKNIFKDIHLEDIGKIIRIDAEMTSEDINEKRIPRKQALIEQKKKDDLKKLKKKVEDELAQKKIELEKQFEVLMQQKQQERQMEIEEQANGWLEKKKQEAQDLYEERVKNAESFYQDTLAQTKSQTEQMISDAESNRDKIRQEAFDEGHQKGKEEGYQSGFAEVKRLTGRLNNIISEMIRKRNSIIEGIESQLIDIVILIARKIVRTISQDQRRLVYDNIRESLNILKGRSHVTIRVNSEDLDVATHHKQEFIDMLEGIESLKILEDNSVDKGGCHIDTEFGYIDARISSQLSEVEEQIKQIKPIQEGF